MTFFQVTSSTASELTGVCSPIIGRSHYICQPEWDPSNFGPGRVNWSLYCFLPVQWCECCTGPFIWLLWVLAERMSSWIQMTEICFFQRIAGLLFSDRTRKSVIQEGLRFEPVLLHQMKPVEVVWASKKIPYGGLLGEMFLARPIKRRPWATHSGEIKDYRDIFLSWPGNTLVLPLMS